MKIISEGDFINPHVDVSFSVGTKQSCFRRAEDNPLDLNNFPDDFCTKDGKQVVDGSSSSAGGGSGAGGGHRKKKGGGGKERKEERGKAYECRFCSLKFCKSQALGGHMNRHRQERETETLNRARQLVFGNDALPPPPHHHLGAYHPGSHMSDPILAFRSPSSSSLYTPHGRLFSGSSSASSSSAFLQPYLYQSPSLQPAPYPSSSQFNTSNDFSLGSQGLNRPNQYTGLHGTTHGMGSSESSTNYTCIGAPVGEVGGGPYQKEGLIWGRRMEPQGHNQNHYHGHRNTSSAINRFQDGL